MTVSPRPFRVSSRNRTAPISGRLRDGSAPSTVLRSVSSSPGRTGRSHFPSSTPGLPMQAEPSRNESHSMRISIAIVCQPDAISRPTNVPSALSSPRWKGCGS